MAQKIRVGVLGLTHDHVWSNLEALAGCEEGELVAAADLHEELRERFSQRYPQAQVFDDYERMLDAVELDAVYVFSDNLESVELVELAADRGLHAMVEKPMASSLSGAARMMGAAQEAGTILMVNWPIAWSPAVQHAFNLIHQGRIGELYQVHYRSAHAGPREIGCSSYFCDWLYDPLRNGAGAYMDYCCYGAAMTCYLLGLPSRVTATMARLRKRDLAADDNAVLIMQHARAMSTAVASWTQIGHLTSYEPTFYGSEGTILVRGRQLLLADAQHDDGQEIEVPEPPEGMRNSAEFFLSHVRQRKPIEGLCSPEVGLMAQEVLEAGIISAQEGTAVSLPLPVNYLQGWV